MTIITYYYDVGQLTSFDEWLKDVVKKIKEAKEINLHFRKKSDIQEFLIQLFLEEKDLKIKYKTGKFGSGEYRLTITLEQPL